MTQPDTKNHKESKTLDVKKSIRFTDRITLRMDPETKRLLKQVTQAMGMSECHLIHALLTAYFYGLGERLNLDVKSPTINLTIEREVKRVRRYAREAELETNFYDLGLTSWIYVSDVVLNENGHALGCACSKCRRSI